jgi:XRE family transcriptional regulator, regulator of sulfur utilization
MNEKNFADRSEHILKTLSRNIYRFRNQRRLNQDELAQKAGMKRATLSNLENAHCEPSITNIVKIAEVLNVGVDDLLQRKQWVLDTRVIREQVSGDIRILNFLPEQPKGFTVEKIILSEFVEVSFESASSGSIEIIFVLAGEISIDVGESGRVIGKGTRIEYRADQIRKIKNPWPEDAEVLRIVIPFTFGDEL